MTKKNDFTDDGILFRTTVGNVKRIESDRVLLSPNRKPRPVPKRKPIKEPDPLQRDACSSPSLLYQEDVVEFTAPGISKNILKKLRRGSFGLDANLDLHGRTSREALWYLLEFLRRCRKNGYRCVRIVHGKGYHSRDDQPVLKNDINDWLRRHNDVLAFCSAPARAGGAGALFVLLRSEFPDNEFKYDL